MKKKILVLGGTGAMGVYLTPQLLEMGYAVDVVSLDSMESGNPNLKYITANACDDIVLSELLKNEYDGIIDFMVYDNPEKTFAPRRDILLKNTDHYIFLSSYRVYAGKDRITTEASPRLLDVSDDEKYLAAKNTEYSLYKAIGENILSGAERKNWSIVRPAITYSKRRFQLVTLEAQIVIERMKSGRTVVLPQQAMEVETTMSWAGDVAKMLARLLFNRESFGEVYTTATAEHHTWREIAEYYGELGGLKYTAVDKEEFLHILSPGKDILDGNRWQLEYDRMLNRVMDNSKILGVTGLNQSELMPLKEGLRRELSELPEKVKWQWADDGVSGRMDKYLEKLNGGCFI